MFIKSLVLDVSISLSVGTSAASGHRCAKKQTITPGSRTLERVFFKFTMWLHLSYSENIFSSVQRTSEVLTVTVGSAPLLFSYSTKTSLISTQSSLIFVLTCCVNC